MKTLKTEPINEIQIITGFKKRPVDPVASKQGAATALVEALPEFKEMKNKYSDMLLHTQKARNEEKKAIEFRRQKNPTQADIHSEKCKEHHGAANIGNDDRKVIQAEFVPKQNQILRDNIVYFEPRLGEVIKSESEIADLEELFLG